MVIGSCVNGDRVLCLCVVTLPSNSAVAALMAVLSSFTPNSLTGAESAARATISSTSSRKPGSARGARGGGGGRLCIEC